MFLYLSTSFSLFLCISLSIHRCILPFSHPSTCLSKICLSFSIDRPIYLSVYLFIYRFIYLFIYLCVYLPNLSFPILLSIYLSICLSVYDLPVCLFIDLSSYLLVYLSTCLFMYLFIYLTYRYLPSLSIHPPSQPSYRQINEIAVPATKSAPHLAKVLRLPAAQLRPCKVLRCCANKPCAAPGPHRARPRQVSRQWLTSTRTRLNVQQATLFRDFYSPATRPNILSRTHSFFLRLICAQTSFHLASVLRKFLQNFL